MIERISSLDGGYKSGDLSLFPQALDDHGQLYVASNNSRTKLAQTLTYNNLKTMVVDDTGGFPASGIVRVGPDIGVDGNYELIVYSSKTGSAFQGLQRGYAGTRQNVWRPQDIFVTNSVLADFHNSVKDAVINIEHDLGLVLFPSTTSLNGILTAQEVRFLAPKPLFRAFPPKGPPPLQVRFQNFTTGFVIRYLWDFGDGGTSLERSPIHTYLNEGQYTVKLNIITSTGAQGVVTKSNYITVNIDEEQPFFYVESLNSPYSVQTATSLTAAGKPTVAKEFVFVDQTDGDIVQRNWVFGDGNKVTVNDPNSHIISHIYSLPGNYVVTQLIIFSNGRLKKVEIPSLLVL